MSDARADDLALRLCADCGGRALALDMCGSCEGAGVFDQDGRPFHAPPPFDRWTPAALVALDRHSRARGRSDAEPLLEAALAASRPDPHLALADDGEGSTTTEGRPSMARPRTLRAATEPEPPRRMTMSRIVELLLARSPTDHSSVKLARNARGGTQVEVHVRTGEPGLETPEQARDRATALYDDLTARYPHHETE